MCLVSEKVKLCTCVSSSVDRLRHYWILHRYNKNKDEFILGMPALPYDFDVLKRMENSDTFLTRLNEEDAFDQPMHFKNKDQLEIVLNNHHEEDKSMTFCFKYKRDKWVSEEYDVFELANEYDEKAFGKFRHLKKKHYEKKRRS